MQKGSALFCFFVSNHLLATHFDEDEIFDHLWGHSVWNSSASVIAELSPEININGKFKNRSFYPVMILMFRNESESNYLYDHRFKERGIGGDTVLRHPLMRIFVKDVTKQKTACLWNILPPPTRLSPPSRIFLYMRKHYWEVSCNVPLLCIQYATFIVQYVLSCWLTLWRRVTRSSSWQCSMNTCKTMHNLSQ